MEFLESCIAIGVGGLQFGEINFFRFHITLILRLIKLLHSSTERSCEFMNVVSELSNSER